MKPAWDQLGDAFASSKTVIIGDVDCTIHKNVCSRFGVRGYPTIKYFTGDTAADGDKYEGGRDFNSLKQFADENLGPSCSNDNKDLCNEDQLALLEEANALSAEDLQAAIDSKAQELAQAETDFKAEVEGLNQRYQELMKEKDAKIAAVSPSLKMYRAAARSASEAAADKDEL